MNKKQNHNKNRLKQRNPVALNPLLQKSQAHRKTNKANRKGDKVSLKKTWFEQAATVLAACQNHVVQRFASRWSGSGSRVSSAH